ncbi:MAG: arginase family protein [Candidatus Parvarchaeota archaeon]|nr:arginase family protein [Candidatus Rehaiarchaeum fermentans]
MLMSEGSWGFLEEEISYDKAKYVVIPCPYEATQTGKRGTDKGCFSIISASKLLENFNYEFNFNVKDLIYTSAPLKLSFKPEQAIQEIQKNIEDVIKDNKTPIIIGGEHTVALGSLNLGHDFIVFDAHADFREEFNGEKYSHASVIKRMSEKARVIIIGTRSISLEEKEMIEQEKNVKIFFIDQLDKLDFSYVGRDVWISIDMDVFDPSIVPNVAVPSPNGINYEFFRKALNKIFIEKNPIGMDISEIVPSEDLIGEILSSKCILDFVSLKELSNS